MKVGIFGTGAYGMALASIISENNIEITMWTKFEDEKNNLDLTRKNDKLLPGYILNEKIRITTSVEECAKDKDLLIIAIPVAFISDLCKELSLYVADDDNICIASKGIEQKTGLFINQIIEKYLRTKNIAIISGPSFAKDIIEKKPIGLTLATKSEIEKELIFEILKSNYIKLMYTRDIIGVEVCGSIKNVIALAGGILEGLGSNDSTNAMFITESLNVIGEIIQIFGGDKETIYSFAGIGDLLLTCTSINSRNYTYGKLVGENKSKEELETYLNTNTVEGYYTLGSIYDLLKEKNIEIPIINLIYEIIRKDIKPSELLKLMVENNNL